MSAGHSIYLCCDRCTDGYGEAATARSVREARAMAKRAGWRTGLRDPAGSGSLIDICAECVQKEAEDQDDDESSRPPTSKEEAT